MLQAAYTSSNSLPLDNIMIISSELYPKISELQSSLSGTTVNTAIVDLLRSAALEHHLPKPPPLHPRRFAVRSFCYACCLDMTLIAVVCSGLMRRSYG